MPREVSVSTELMLVAIPATAIPALWGAYVVGGVVFCLVLRWAGVGVPNGQ
jgi:hypothetical protein